MRPFLSSLTLSSSLLLLTACGGSSDSATQIDADDGLRQLNASIPFIAVVDDETVACGQDYLNVGADSSTVSFVDFRLFLHDFRLITDDGKEVALPLTALTGESPAQNVDVVQLDFRDTIGCEAGVDANPNFNDEVSVSATLDSDVSYAAIRFSLGVPAALNHADQSAADEPLRNPGRASGAAWNWQGGYKFTGIDVEPVGGWTDPADDARVGSRWNVHVGSTGCPVSASELESGDSPQPCAQPNRAEVTLALGTLDIGQIQIVIDYAALVSGASVAQDSGGASGCMSGTTDPECEAVFANLGLAWGENPATSQTVFRLREASDQE